MDAILNAAIALQVLVRQPLEQVGVDTGLRHLVRILLEAGVDFLEPVVELARVARLVVGRLFEGGEFAQETRSRDSVADVEVAFERSVVELQQEVAVDLKVEELLTETAKANLKQNRKNATTATRFQLDKLTCDSQLLTSRALHTGTCGESLNGAC